ncbi:MAG: hypothetical protein QM702_21590 [Rubrivivax sp.]
MKRKRLGVLFFVTGVAAACSSGNDVISDQVPVDNRPDTVFDPSIANAPSAEGNVISYAGTSLGTAGMSLNGRIHPHGKPMKYYFEWGPTTDYGSKTQAKALPPKLAAHYAEGWNGDVGGWRGGSGRDLKYFPTGGVTGGHVRYAEPTGDDYNHEDGIGLLHLVQYFYIGTFDADAPTSALGGSQPDMRDAKIRIAVRGNSWRPNGTELLWWSQIDVNRGHPMTGQGARYSNWAHTGFNLTDYLASGNWESVEYRLWNDTSDWSYAGSNRELNKQLGRGEVYVYAPLDDVLSNLDTDIFHVLTYIDRETYPTGTIDFDDLEITYRNHSLVFPPNGGKLASAPDGSDDPAPLTDGWRNGDGKTWASAPSPKTPQEIVYDFARPVTIDRVQIHQNPTFPSKDVEIAVFDGKDWTTIASGEIPEVLGSCPQVVGDPAPGTTSPTLCPSGPNFAFFLQTDIAKDFPIAATKMKVRVLSGRGAARWGLGEIEAFGTGAVEETEDDWYRVTSDIGGLTTGQTVHYRLVTVTDEKTELGGDLSFVVPMDGKKPEVVTGAASRIANTTAKLEGRLNTYGQDVDVWFDYGLDRTYGAKSKVHRAGQEITPHTVTATITDLVPGRTFHYRLAVSTSAGITYGNDYVFVAR